MKTSSKIAALIAASVLALSSTAYAAGNNQGKGGTENSCAVGNMPVPGANCTP